ncbi:hypothetical protein [Cohnella yongneupensis]|uniref:Uncharacterized protein n=1 Tax=Cohnella yongneupensis TaxID=425006 RepID=A0ABW0QZD7_9BACL
MIPELLLIFGFYVAAAVWAHWAYRKSAGASRRHYVLVAGNHQTQIEGYVRGLQRYSRRTGTEIGITVVLEDSSDETGAIMEKFARGNAGIGIVRREDELEKARIHHWERSREAEQFEPEQVIWVELECVEHISKLPYRRL